MGTNSLANIALLMSISTSVINLPYDSDTLIPQLNHNYNYQNNIADWKDHVFNTMDDYQLQNENIEKIKTIIDFSNKLIQNTTDIDGEFVDIVNKHFWELI